MTPRPTEQGDLARFLAKIEHTDSCWLWRGSILQPNGYGAFWLRGRQRLAHRVAYEHFVGPIPEGMQIDHVRARGCTSKTCVNPDHLEAVTPRENSLRTDSPAAINARKTHCPNGHLLDGRTARQRTCKTCLRESARKRRAAAKAAA